MKRLRTRDVLAYAGLVTACVYAVKAYLNLLEQEREIKAMESTIAALEAFNARHHFTTKSALELLLDSYPQEDVIAAFAKAGELLSHKQEEEAGDESDRDV